MPKTARLELRISGDLKVRVDAEAERRGQKITTFVERALEKALGEGQAEGSGSPPASSSRSPAPPRTPARSAPSFNRATSLKR